MIANRQDLKQGLLDAASWNTDQVMICATLRDASLVSAASDVPIANPRRKRFDFDEAYLSGFEWITRKKRFALADVRSVIRSRCGPDKRLRQRSPVRPLRVRPDRRGSRREFAGSMVLPRPQAEAALRTAIKDGRIRPWSGVDPSSGESFVDPSWFDRAKMVSLPLEPHRLPPGSHQSFKALAFQNMDSGVVLWLRFNPAEVLSVFPTKDEKGTASATPGSTREKAETAAAEQGPDTGRHGAASDKPNEALVLASDTAAQRRTGVPGRPSSADLLLPEAERRVGAGEALPSSLAAFAREMSEWLKSAHPCEPKLTPRSAENVLRAMWTAHKNRPIKSDPEPH
jgi:hypothetical protein